MSKKIKTIPDYIDMVNTLTHKFKSENKIVVYRGENLDFGETSCVPNIYRQDVLNGNPRFEKNLFDEMTANDLSVGGNYLEKAISAQHDGFPSRLLDVSYNCLIALYFACTPYYHKDEDENDGKDGKVFLFAIEKMFCPTGENIVENYNEIINANSNSFIKQQLFAKNHKLIDHIKTNKRIIAQQGAFILFQGNEYEKIPNRLIEEITIDGNSKAQLRKDLSSLFGIDTGSVYPLAENFVDKMIRRSNFVDNSLFCFENELKMIIYNLEQDFDNYIKIISETIKNQKIKKVIALEQLLKDYFIGIKDLKKFYIDNCNANSENCQIFKNFICDYNNIVSEELDYINNMLKTQAITIEFDDFKIIDGENYDKEREQ